MGRVLSSTPKIGFDGCQVLQLLSKRQTWTFPKTDQHKTFIVLNIRTAASSWTAKHKPWHLPLRQTEYLLKMEKQLLLRNIFFYSSIQPGSRHSVMYYVMITMCILYWNNCVCHQLNALKATYLSHSCHSDIRSLPDTDFIRSEITTKSQTCWQLRSVR